MDIDIYILETVWFTAICILIIKDKETYMVVVSRNLLIRVDDLWPLCMSSQGGRGSGSKWTKLSGSCRATSLTMQSTCADSKTATLPPAALCAAQPMAILQAPMWQTTTHRTTLFVHKAQILSTDNPITSSKQFFFPQGHYHGRKTLQTHSQPLNMYSADCLKVFNELQEWHFFFLREYFPWIFFL